MELWSIVFNGRWIASKKSGDKKDSTLNLLAIRLDKVMVKFKAGPDNYETELGHICI